MDDKSAGETGEAKIVRDARIDQIGLVDEIKKQHADKLRGDVKTSMLGKSAQHAEGDLFDALLVTGGETRTIDPTKYFKLVEAKKITRAKILETVKISVDAAGEILSQDEIAKVSESRPSPPTLRIARKKGVSIALLDAVKQIAAAIMG